MGFTAGEAILAPSMRIGFAVPASGLFREGPKLSSPSDNSEGSCIAPVVSVFMSKGFIPAASEAEGSTFLALLSDVAGSRGSSIKTPALYIVSRITRCVEMQLTMDSVSGRM